MKIAVPYENGRIFQSFGHTEWFKIYEIADLTVTGAQLTETGCAGHGALAGFLREQGVAVLLCGVIGAGAQQALADAGIAVYAGASGDADETLRELVEDHLAYGDAPTCGGHTCTHDCAHCG
ncbi:MAG: NifB/NifX family molybdenum-iron cluster-binding protein [Oscillospiraceae bacterium]|nr:NifB/NifX family molybdenum-iron cluster-binding protein [Oscillospiraceae bacterium]